MEQLEIISEKQLEELSTEEFQQKLHAWYRECGLMSDLRAYLRRQMILLLQKTSLGQSLSEAMPHTISPKMQATNLLIAEFLLRQQNHYTLSVFTSENPFLQTFPEFSESDQIQPRRKRCDRLKVQDAIDILDTVGLSQGTNEGENILTVYQNNDYALLTCIIRCLSTLTTQKKTENDTFVDLEPILEKNSPYFLSALQNILIKAKVRGHVFFYLREHINSLFETEINKVKIEEENKLKNAIDEKEKEFNSRLNDKEKDTLKMIAESELKIKEYKKKCKQEMKVKQNQLEKLAEQLHVQHQQVKSSLEEIQNRTDDFQIKERRLKQIYAQKSEEMAELKSELQLRHEMLCAKEASIIKLKQDLKTSQIAILEAASSQEISQLKQQCSILKEELEEAKSKIIKPKATPDKEIQSTDSFENVKALKDSLDQVQRENTELRLRLDAMSQRCDALTSNVANTLHFRIPNQSESGEAIPIAANRPVSRRRMRIDSRQLGGGEESRLDTSALRERGAVRSRERREWQRRINRVVQYSSSSDSSPTDDVVRDARTRLRRLQEETDSIHRSYREFRRRQTQNPFPELNSFRSGMTPSCSHERPFGGFTFETSRPRAMFNFQQVDQITQRFHDVGARDMQNLNAVRFKFSSVSPLKTNFTLPKTGETSHPMKGRRNSLDDVERENIATTLEHVINKLESAQTKLDTSLSSPQPEIEPKERSQETSPKKQMMKSNTESIQTGIDNKNQLLVENDKENINEQSFIELIEISQNTTKHLITGIQKQDQSTISADNSIESTVDALKPEITHETGRNSLVTAESAPETVESRLETVEIRLKAAESRCLVTAESAPETVESRLETVEIRLKAAESRLKVAESKSETAESRSETSESRPRTAENKSLSALETGTSKSEITKKEPETTESRRETVESRRETTESLSVTETKETTRNEIVELSDQAANTDSLLKNDDKENIAIEISKSNPNTKSEFVVVSDNGNKNITGILIETIRTKNMENSPSETHIQKSKGFPVSSYELKEKQNKTYKTIEPWEQTNQGNEPIDLIIPPTDKSFTEKIEKLKSSLLEIDDIEKKFNETVATPFFMREYNLTSIENELYNINSYKTFDTANIGLSDNGSNETEISDRNIPTANELAYERALPGPSQRINDGIEVIYSAKLDPSDERPSVSGITTSSLAADVVLSDSSSELEIRPKPSLMDLSISSVEPPISDHLSAGYESNNDDDFWN